jgi:hypothetical protein
MSAYHFGLLTGSFAVSLLLASVWLIVSRAIPPLRARPAFTYGIAVALAFVPPFVAPDGPDEVNLFAALLCSAILHWQYRRARAKISRNRQENEQPSE